MILGRFHHQSGIALGPVLFIIAALAIIAAAIVAGSGGFNANTQTESNKAMAEVVIQSGHAYIDAINLMLGNGCDPTLLDYTPAGNGWPTGAGTWTTGDYTGGNGTGHTGNGTCALFDPRGGGMIFKPLPAAALVSNPTGAYSAARGGPSPQVDAFAGYPFFGSTTCLYGFGTCIGPGNNLTTSQSNAALLLQYYYVNYSVCVQINNILHVNMDPNATANTTSQYQFAVFSGSGLRTAPTYVPYSVITANSNLTEGCALDNDSNGANSAYSYTIALMIR